MYRYIFYLLLLITLSFTPIYAQDQVDQNQVVELYNQAEVAYEKGDLTQAISLYKKVIEQLPEAFEPKYQCANAYLATKKPEFLPEAIALLKDVTQLKPDFARGFATLGNALARSNDIEAAENALRQALSLEPALPVRALLAELLLTRQAYKEAEIELKTLISQEKNNSRNYLLLGISQQEQNLLEPALASYNRANELQPNDSEILYRRGQLHQKQKNFASSIADLKIAYQLSKNDFAIGLMLIETYRQSGDNKTAINLAQSLLDKNSPENQAVLTELLAQLGANADAIGQLEKLLASDPKNVKHLSRLGELYLDINPEKSSQYWQQAFDTSPNIETEVGLASSLLKAQKYKVSIEHFNNVLVKAPQNYEAHAGLALALFKLNNFAPAAENFLWIIKARPENSISYYFLGICFDKLMDYQQALKAYELFLQVADTKLRQGEIEQVRQRLPILRRQLEKQPKKK